MNTEQFIEPHLPELTTLRRTLHQYPELSKAEKETAGRIRRYLFRYEPDEIISDIGGAGLVAVYKGKEPGPTVMLRCELDALPIEEQNAFEHRSTVPGVSHKCGHDGHMAIAAGMAIRLSQNPPKRGQVVLLFQPDEEQGTGAASMLDDPKFKAIRPDYAFALHNLPGFPLGCVISKSGTFHCASRGLVIKLSGRASHSAFPEEGRSATPTMIDLIRQLSALPKRPQFQGTFSQVTITHCRLGEPTFNFSPADAEIFATLRSDTNQGMALLVETIHNLVEEPAAARGIGREFEWRGEYPATFNHEEAYEIIRKTAQLTKTEIIELEAPIRAADDFSRFMVGVKGGFFGLGSGETCPPLHSVTYDFPDALISKGVILFSEIVDQILNT